MIKRNTHTVLFAICYRLNESVDNEGNTESTDKERDEITDHELFSTLMAEFQNEGNGDRGTSGVQALLIDVDLGVYMIDESEQGFRGACIHTGASICLAG